MAKLVLLGGGHAHMTILANLDRITEKGHQAVVVQPSEFHYYSGMGPGMLGGTYEPEDIRFDTRRIVERQGGTFVKDVAVSIDYAASHVNLGNGTRLGYDLLSCNTGSFVPVAEISSQKDSIIPAKPIEGLARARKRIVKSLESGSITIGVIGGGPSAVEIAGNLRQLANRHTRHPMKIVIFCGRKLLADSPGWLQVRATRMLNARSVEIHQGRYVADVTDGAITLTDGSSQRFDMIFGALGVRPSPLFENSTLSLGPDKALKVNQFLQSVDSPFIFGGGDCIHFSPRPLDKVGVYAVRQNQLLLNNLLASLAGGGLEPFEPGAGYLLIYNLGGGQGIFIKGPLKFSGVLAFKIKDYIDKKFIRRFKNLET